MRHRVLGNSGLRLAEVGYGAWGVGNSSWLGAIGTALCVAPAAMAETVLRFVLSHPAVSVVIPGMGSPRNVGRNCALAAGRPLSAAQLAILARHRRVRNFYQ